MDHLLKTKKRILKFKETRDTKYIYKDEFKKACFQDDIAYKGFKDLARNTNSDKILRNKEFNIAKNQGCDRYQRGLASIVHTFFDKKTSSGATKSMPNQKLTNELNLQTCKLATENKPMIRKFGKRKVYS